MAYILERDADDDESLPVTEEMRRRIRAAPVLRLPVDAHLGTSADEASGLQWLAEQRALESAAVPSAARRSPTSSRLSRLSILFERLAGLLLSYLSGPQRMVAVDRDEGRGSSPADGAREGTSPRGAAATPAKAQRGSHKDS
jgi:hypothetical protein